MGLFERMKLAGKEVVTEETEPLKDGQLPILEKTAGLVVQPSKETSSLLGKRRAEATDERVKERYGCPWVETPGGSQLIC
jgi:hypothetical protein